MKTVTTMVISHAPPTPTKEMEITKMVVIEFQDTTLIISKTFHTKQQKERRLAFLKIWIRPSFQVQI